MKDNKLVLRVDHNSTYIEGRMSSEIYDKFKRELGYLPENSFWMIKNNSEKAKGHEKWKTEWDGNISAVCWNKNFCHCHIKKRGLHFQTGLLSKAVTFLRANDVPFRRVDIRSKTEKTNRYSMSKEFEFRDYQQEVINKVVGNGQALGIDRGVIQAATGSGKCLNKDSLCFTEEGMIEIGKIEGDILDGEYKEKQIGVYTPFNCGDKDVSSYVYKDGIKDSIKITTSYGYSVTGTPNHKIIVLGDNGDLIWKRLDEISKSDKVVISKNQNIFGNNDKFTVEEAYFLGLLYGDGSLNNKYTIKLTTVDDHIEDYVVAYASENGLKTNIYYDKRTKNTRSIDINNKKYREYLFDKGINYCLSYTKEIPLNIRTSPKSIIAAFLRGIYETDGSVESDNKIVITLGLSNEKLIDQIHYILLNMGIIASKRKKKTTHRDCYILSIYKPFVKQFIDEIGFDPEGHKKIKVSKFYSDFITVKNNSNKDLIYNQNKNIKEIKLIIKSILGANKYKKIIEEESGIKINVLRSWSDNSYWRNPSRYNLLKFLKWVEYKFVLKEIGIKNNRYNELKKLVNNMLEIVNEKYYYECIKRIEKCKSDNYDFVIPKTHSFVANGFINHNTSLAAAIIAKIGVSPTIFYVPSIDLLIQAKNELEKFIKQNNLGIKVGMIGGGRKDIQDINVMTIQTAVKSLGGVWVKFDDEDNFKDDTNIEDVKENVKKLIRNSKLMICDEVQHWAAETCQIISDAAESCQYRFGMSVFSDSLIELRGACFKRGTSCTIEEAWEQIFKLNYGKYHQVGGYDIINVEGIESRGWNGENFEWKIVKNFIRHINNKNSYSVRFSGAETIKMTEDHSIFKIDNNKVICCNPKELNKGDILLLDDGDNVGSCQKVFTALDILSLNPRKMRVAIDLSGFHYNKLNLSKERYYQLTHRGEIAKKYGGSLYLKDYLKFKDILPSPKWIYVEGDNNTGIAADLTIEDIPYLLGFYIGDGWVNETRLNFAVERKFKEEFLKKVNDIKKIKVNFKVRELDKGSVEIRYSCRPLVDFIDFYFSRKKGYDKKIPDELLFNRRDIKLNLIDGLVDSDGSRKKTKQDEIKNCKSCNFTTTSYKLKNNLCLLLRSLDVPYTVAKRLPRLGGVIDGRQIKGKHISYQTIWSENAIHRKNEGRNGKNNKTTIKCIEKKVIDIVPIQNEGYVYDIEMSGHPSFVANGVLVHNSATPYRDKGDDILIEGCFGRTLANINASFLIKRGYLVKPVIYFEKINNMRGLRKSSYANIYKQAIIENADRNERIRNLATTFFNEGRKILILVKQIKHGKMLEDIIPESIFVHGGTSKKKRADHLGKMRKGGPQITIASVIFDEGIDVRPLNTLILAGGGKSPTRALQRIGRILRPYEGKKDAIAVDFMDNCKYMLAHSKKRLSIYKTEEEFEIVGV